MKNIAISIAKVWTFLISCILLLASGIWNAYGADAPFLLVGVCTHINPDGSSLRDDMPLIEGAGFRSIRNDVYWKDVELKPGQLVMPRGIDQMVQQSIDNHIEPLLVLGYGNQFYDGGNKPTSNAAIDGYVRYAEFVVKHFSGKVHLYEIWNEWNGPLGGVTRGTHTRPGKAEDYVRLLSAVYPRLKAIDPNVIVIGGAVSPGGISSGFVQKDISLGLVHSADAFSFHPYNWMKSDSTQQGSRDWADAVFKTESELRKANNGKDFPVYVTEIGWPTFSGEKGISQAQSSDRAAQMLLLAKTMPYVKGIWWYDLRDDSPKINDPESNFGLFKFDRTPKPAYFVMKNLMTLMTQGQFISETPVDDPNIRVLQFQLASGEKRTAIWSSGEVVGAKNLTIRAPDGTRLRLSHPGDLEESTPKPRGSAKIEVSTAPSPIIVQGTVSAVTTKRH